MTIIIQFVSVVTASESNTLSFRSHTLIKKNFLGFMPLSETGSAFMTKVLKELQEMGLEVDNLQTQGYDNWSISKILQRNQMGK